MSKRTIHVAPVADFVQQNFKWMKMVAMETAPVSADWPVESRDQSTPAERPFKVDHL